MTALAAATRTRRRRKSGRHSGLFSRIVSEDSTSQRLFWLEELLTLDIPEASNPAYHHLRDGHEVDLTGVEDGSYLESFPLATLVSY